jgi:hypothetical protein
MCTCVCGSYSKEHGRQLHHQSTLIVVSNNTIQYFWISLPFVMANFWTLQVPFKLLGAGYVKLQVFSIEEDCCNSEKPIVLAAQFLVPETNFIPQTH